MPTAKKPRTKKAAPAAPPPPPPRLTPPPVAPTTAPPMTPTTPPPTTPRGVTVTMVTMTADQRDAMVAKLLEAERQFLGGFPLAAKPMIAEVAGKLAQL